MDHRTALTRIRALSLALALLVPFAAVAEHRVMTDEDLAYPGTVVIADGHGKVDVRIVYQAQEGCWRINGAREGVPNPALDMPTDRHLYITVAIERLGGACAQALTPIETRVAIADKPGRITLDIFFVDERGVYQRSQRHRIQRN